MHPQYLLLKAFTYFINNVFYLAIAYLDMAKQLSKQYWITDQVIE